MIEIAFAYLDLKTRQIANSHKRDIIGYTSSITAINLYLPSNDLESSLSWR